MLLFKYFTCFKGTLMQIWKSTSIFALTWKVLQDRLLFEIYTPKIFEILVGKNTKTIEFIKN